MIYHNSGKKYPQFRGKIFQEEYHSDNVKVIRCHDSNGSQESFISRLKVYFVFVFTSTWAGIFKAKKKFDVIVVSSPPLFVGITALIISKIKNIPFIFEIRDLWPESAIDTGIIRNKYLIKLALLFEKVIYKQAIAINVLTPAFKEVLIKKKGVPSNKILYISNACDFSLSDSILESFNPLELRSKLGIEPETFVITYVGAHGVANGLDLVLSVAKLLKNENVLFLLIGDGMLKADLIKRVINEDIINVKLLESVSKVDAIKYIVASDAGLSILIKNDTFKTVYSNKTFDYMSCKKPTLMAIEGVSRDLIEDSNAGLFIEPGNTTDFVDKVLYYLKNRHLVQEHGNNGYLYAKKYFDRSVLANFYVEKISEHIKLDNNGG
jgi:glycosyltransferase involved in cell wall biosynthesis